MSVGEEAHAFVNRMCFLELYNPTQGGRAHFFINHACSELMGSLGQLDILISTLSFDY